jgi:polysaccharide chain length determinant protein (PEP-CTERM system associated)
MQMPMQTLTLSEIFKSVGRRPWWLVVPIVLCLAAGYGVFRTMTPIYRASTLVMVEKQKVPADYVKATVTTDIDERLKTIEQQITNRDNLERIIVEMNLYPDVRSGAPADKVVEQMRRRDLAVERRGDVFRIYFKDRDPVRAAAVANRIAELFIVQNLKIREDQAQGTSSFLETELAETKGKLEQQEARIAAFKRVYIGALPEQRDANLQAVGQLQTKLEINMDAVDKAEMRKIFLQAQIAEMQKPAPVAPVLPPVSSGPAAPTRLDQLRAQLIELTGRYTDRHPDVIRIREEIARLEKLESTRIEVSEAPAMPAPAPRIPPVSPALRAELEAVNLEIGSLRAERERILADISRYQARVEAIPGVEQQLLSLTRDYENIKRSYESLLAKRIEARLAENLEKSRQGEQFTILEKAVPPSEPYAPKLLFFLVGGFAAGALLGLAAALLRAQTDSTYGSAEELQQAFPGVPVLATIPIFSSRETAGFRNAAAAARRFRRQ